MEALRTSGRRIPDDVAVIGFDDILEARSQLPPLTTVRHPTFTLGYQAVLSVLASIRGEMTGETSARVATQLIVRQSCGCRLESVQAVSLGGSPSAELESIQAALSRLMAEAVFAEVRHSRREDIETLCLDLVRSLASSLARHDPAYFDDELQRLLGWLEMQAEDAYAWHGALSTLHSGLPGLISALPQSDPGFAGKLIDRARLAIAALVQRQTTEALVRHMATSNRLGLMTSQRPGVMRLGSYQALARGANGIMFFQWRASSAGSEKFHSAMVPHVGTDARVWREVKALGAELRGLDALLSSRVQSDAAILFDWENWWALEGGDKPANDLTLLSRITALYAELFRRNVTVDFAHPEGDLSRYRLVIAPHLYMVSDRASRNIEQYVADGGTLLMTFFSGIVDGNEHVRLGGYPAPFRALLGLWVEEFAPYGETETNQVELEDGKRFSCDLWSDVICLEGAEVLARYREDYFAGGPAVTRHRSGQGIAYYLGTSLRQDGLSWLLGRVLADAGLQSANELPRGVEITRRSDGRHTWLFVLNYSEEPAQVELPAGGVNLLTGAETKESLHLGPKGVAIVQIPPS
jgi:hypothetical protein